VFGLAGVSAGMETTAGWSSIVCENNRRSSGGRWAQRNAEERIRAVVAALDQPHEGTAIGIVVGGGVVGGGVVGGGVVGGGVVGGGVGVGSPASSRSRRAPWPASSMPPTARCAR
jgi:hypothetical protein